VLAEMLLGQPLFPGESGVAQLVEIIKVLGTPSREEINAMNPNYTEFRFPQIKAHPWSKVFHKRMPADAVDLVSKLLQYSPNLRYDALQVRDNTFLGQEGRGHLRACCCLHLGGEVAFSPASHALLIRIESHAWWCPEWGGLPDGSVVAALFPQACAHPFFDELREPTCRLPSGRPIPPLFDLAPAELKNCTPQLLATLIPPHARQPGHYETLVAACQGSA
jgi:hypothetical protein